MKILIVSKTFYPINSPRSFRATELAKGFSRMHNLVTIYTVKDDLVHGQFERDYGVVIKTLGRPLLRSLDICTGGRWLGWAKRVINRGLNLFFEYPDIEFMFKVRKVLLKESGYDLLISIAVPYPVHWGVAWAMERNKSIAKSWIADCGDPYMGDTIDSFRKPFYFRYLEDWFGAKADAIAITNISMKQNYYHDVHHKIVEITQGFDFEEARRHLADYVPNSVPTFAYAGTLIPGARDPRPLLEFLVTYESGYRFLIYTKQRYLVEPYLDRSGGRIVLKEELPRMELLRVLGCMDFLVNIGYDSAVQSPSKLIDYYLVGRPVLSLPSNGADEKVICEFLAGDYRNAFVFDNYEKFRIENVCNQFLELANHLSEEDVITG